MTLQEAERTIAREMGYKSWGNAMLSKKLDKEHLIEEVARLYAKSKWDEAATEQRTLANKHCMKFHSHVLLELPKPEFKP